MQYSFFDYSTSFDNKALQVFQLQYEQNPIYRRFCEALVVREATSLRDIPLLPIQAFKDARVITKTSSLIFQDSTLFFESSGTSGMQRSRHFVPDPQLYHRSIIEGMKHFYTLDELVILAYTQGYNSNPHSSLVWMLNVLMEEDETGKSQFLKSGTSLDYKLINEISASGKRIMLFGAAFGLLDLQEFGNIDLPEDTIVMETGGMKTHRREMTRQELHEKLASGFGLPKVNIHSEYGMTELLSQAYCRGNEWFECVPWMQVSVRNPENPMQEIPYGEEGLIGVIDLANQYSCSFILTGDKGIQNEKGQFQVLGRWNPANLRGCNFLIDSD